MSSISSGVSAVTQQLQSQLASTAAASAIATEQAAVSGLLEILEESQARIEAAQASPPPTLDGTGQALDISV